MFGLVPLLIGGKAAALSACVYWENRVCPFCVSMMKIVDLRRKTVPSGWYGEAIDNGNGFKISINDPPTVPPTLVRINLILNNHLADYVTHIVTIPPPEQRWDTGLLTVTWNEGRSFVRFDIMG